MTAEEVLFKNLLKIEGMTQEAIDYGKSEGLVVHLAILASMEEYAKEQYNQAIDDLIADEVVSNRRDVVKKFKKT